jgi:hypothetical protein
MHARADLRRFGLVFAIAVGIVLFAFARGSGASSRLTVFTQDNRTSRCAAGDVPAAYQDSRIAVDLGQFDAFDNVFIDLTFPDGRTFTINSAFGTSNSLLGLDGVVDQPLNDFLPSGPISVDSGGAAFRSFHVTNDFPYGCYKFTARSPTSGKVAEGSMAIVARPPSAPPPTPAQLRIEDRTTGAQSSQQGAAVNVIGGGFRAQERIYVWITTPDGAVLDWPEQFVSNQFITNDFGEFVATFEFSSYNPTGLYHFTAKGSQSGYLVIAPFTLTARPIAPGGWGRLRVAFPASERGAQRREFEIQGDRFFPNERIDLWMNFPDGAVRGLPSQFVDPYGSFYIVIDTDEELPIGTYKVTAKGAESGSIVITDFVVTFAGGTVVNPSFEPTVIESNSGFETLGGPEFDTRSEGDVGALGAVDNPGPICDATNNFCN